MFRVLLHPVDAFYEIRHRERGSVLLAMIVIGLFGISFTVNRIFASFVVSDIDPRSINGLTEFSAVYLLLFLAALGNWSVTCLLSGEGRFKDIVTVLGYALMPLVLTFIPATIVSQFIAQGEEVFYTFIIGLGIAWGSLLAIMGIMVVHNYTLLKTMATLILTAISMFIIVFLISLLADMLNQVFIFIHGLYIEMIFRF
jgi:hypothetical protein